MPDDDPKRKTKEPGFVDLTLDDLDEALDDDYDEKRTADNARRPTLDEAEQEARSMDLLDRIFDDSADAEIERDGPVDQRGVRLAAFAHGALDELERRGSDGRPVVVDESELPGQRIVLDEQEAATPTGMGPDKIDTARIRRLARPQLVRLVSRLSEIRGEAPPSCEGLSEEQLQDMARRLRVPAQA
ncbi:MAG: hypothetical protein K8M05_38535 [Deltaproteobacteria bacterium]|nr:hypothetical protein [Kofleriaceae bacterium]